jgi:hypothetical protein
VAFPFLDQRLPLFYALLLIYVGIAYFGLPALIRTLRLVVRPNHIPLYATTADGLPSDPVNIAVVAKSRRHFIAAMQSAGWNVSDKVTVRTTLQEAYAIVFAKPYPAAPFSPMYLFNRTFDIGFQIPYGKNGSPRHRHHIRFWHHRERDFVIDTLKKTKSVKGVSEVQAGEPFEIHSQQIGVSFVCDGRLKIVELKK